MQKLIFLGTGTSQGVPVVGCDCEVCRSTDPRDRRLRTSALICTHSTQIVIDAGPDFRYQMLRERLKGNAKDRLDGVVLTHSHHDHIGGLDDVRPYLHIMQKPVALYGNEETLRHVREEAFSYAFKENPYPGAPQFELHTVGFGSTNGINDAEDTADMESFTIGDIVLQPVKILHKADFPILGYRTSDLAYLTDVKFIPDESIKKIRGVRILVINALRGWQHPSHLSLPEALEIIADIKPQMAYLTHISHRFGRYEEVIKQLPKNVQPACDGLTVDF
ncbi:MAG: MBL fold metallo-hydrolase [Bacteroidales bacterium]|jgi:phosphoribosyl 1,2-cyclic phosphate phosphodiesterase|nr:MBL fold metallo-hydrolase [Bacteroidales bacterium]